MTLNIYIRRRFVMLFNVPEVYLLRTKYLSLRAVYYMHNLRLVEMYIYLLYTQYFA